jgi:NAD(P)H-hydrate epimerase
VKLVTSDQMRGLERAAVDAGMSLDALMDAAGLAVAQEVWLLLGVVDGRRILLLAGPGNNGGDGLVAAMHLAEWGADVVAYLPLARAPDDRRLREASGAGASVISAEEDADGAQLQEAIDGAEVIVDALLGIGARLPVEGVVRDVLDKLRDAQERPRPPQVVAVDVPTGVDADSGQADGAAVCAELTVTFGVSKVGLHTHPGSSFAGRVQVIDIGIPRKAEREILIELTAAGWVRERLPARAEDGNKGTFGRVLVIAGSDSYVGAARLCAEAAYRAGAGLVTVACGARLQPMIASALPEATYLLLDDAEGGEEAISDAVQSYDAMIIGPGLGRSARTRTIIDATAPGALPRVIDADAINELSERGTGWHTKLASGAVLTPHPGEMARLLGTTVAAVQADRVRVAMSAASTWEQAVVLKGAHTVAASPDGRTAISPFSNPLLAVAGTGDVLAGVIAGLLAQGMAPFEAAACGVYIHGLAGEELAEELGDRGLLASELAAAIPRAIRTIREGKRAPARSPGRLGDLLAGMEQFGSPRAADA